MRGDEGVGHVDAHNELRSGLLREAARFATTIDIGGPYSVNDPGHVQEHEKTRAALEQIAKVAGITVTLPPVRKLGDHDHSPSDHDLLDQALAEISKAEAWNEASGGAVTYYNSDGYRWQCHTFTGPGSFVVTRSVRSFRVLVCGGGSGAGSEFGSVTYGGDVYASNEWKPATGTYPVTVGANGNGCTRPGDWDTACTGSPGAPSSIGNLTAAGGSTAATGRSNVVSNIRGSDYTYGSNKWTAGAFGSVGDKGGYQYHPENGGPGYPGVVVVAYQIGAA